MRETFMYMLLLRFLCYELSQIYERNANLNDECIMHFAQKKYHNNISSLCKKRESNFQEILGSAFFYTEEVLVLN